MNKKHTITVDDVENYILETEVLIACDSRTTKKLMYYPYSHCFILRQDRQEIKTFSNVKDAVEYYNDI